MIDLTIKTLDSQNHAFSVDDDITVAQFKERIAEVISIPVDSQRLIYCGRVLQDNKKLQEYDVNGKVVHLVQRAPPSSTRRTRSPTPSANTGRRAFQGFNGSANAMYLGSMAFPSGLMEAQGIVPPPPTQSLSGSRLNVARRMIRRAESILNHLEDPQGSRSRDSPPEEPQDEVTPVFAAQVFVPHSHTDDPLASLSAAVSAVEDGIIQEAERALNASADRVEIAPDTAPVIAIETEIGAPEPEAQTTTEKSSEGATTDTNVASSSTSSAAPNGEAAQGSSAQGGSAQNGAAPSGNGRLPENSTGTIEMSRLLDDLNKIHERMRPFMERYHTFMRSDPAVNSEQVPDARATQTVINRVSEIMHLLGHAYHSLSDVMVHVNSPPPRPLLCRPILIQHSAVVQAGIPIQVEAQINLTPDRRASESFTTRSGAAAGDQPASNSDDSASTTPTSTPPNSQAPPTNPNGVPTAHVRPNVHEIRIDSFPFEFRGFPRARTYNITPQGIRAQPAAGGQDTAADAPQAAAGENAQPQGRINPGDPNVVVVPPFVNNPNMEFFMEVTPESITIDSLETTVVTSAAQADNVLRGTFGSPPPEFIQSIIQAVAGQILSGAADIPTPGLNQSPPSTTTSSPTDTPTDPTAQDGSAPASSAHASTGAARVNVNSQARGNTATHPTTATQTRSTSRPHVHLAQHTMQGFDPFLPCNSHHIRHRRRVPAASATQAASTTAAAGAQATAQAPTTGEDGAQNNNQPTNPLYNVLQGLIRSFGNRVPTDPRGRTADATNTASTATPSSATPTVHLDSMPTFIDFTGLSDMLFDARNAAHSSTLASFLQNFPDHRHIEGESLFTDLIMTLARGLTFRDIVQLNNGHVEPLQRIRPALRTFFRNRVLEGECPTQAAIDRGAIRLIVELQPLLDVLNVMEVRDNIDVVQSVTQLCRSRFPTIISLVMSRMTGSLRSLVDQCMLTLRQLCALALHSCVDERQGVETVCETMLARFMQGVSPEIFQWTMSTSRSQLQTFFNTLEITEEEIQPFIVYKSTAEPEEAPPVAEAVIPEVCPEVEAMECEDSAVEEVTPVAPPVVAPPLTFDTADPEPLPNVVIGSEPWHRGLSADWIPIIARDTQRQRRQNPQAPFSDAYLSGMPSKRRKIVAGAKPQGNLSQVISEGVRRAVIETDLTTAAPVEVVAQAARSDVSLQAAYRDLLRTSVQSELRDNPDFTPERFPNAANYFNLQ